MVSSLRWSLIGVVAGTAVVGATAAPAGDLAPAATSEIMSGVHECVAVTGRTSIDEQRLKADGWSKGSMSARGNPVATSLTFYGKGNLLMIFDAGNASPLCTVTAHLTSPADFPGVQSAFAREFGKPVKDDGKGEQMFLAPDHRVVDLAFTGNNDKPSIRAAVGPVFQEAK